MQVPCRGWNGWSARALSLSLSVSLRHVGWARKCCAPWRSLLTPSPAIVRKDPGPRCEYQVYLSSTHSRRVSQVLSSTPRLMLIENFLSPSECEEIQKMAAPSMSPSTVLKQGDQSKGEEKIKDSVRTSETAWLMNKEEPLVAKIRNRVAELVQLPMSFAEDMQVCAFTLQTQTCARSLPCVCRPTRPV